MRSKEHVIVHSLPISRIGEKKYFQISIPSDTKLIIGLEYGVVQKNGAILPLTTGGDPNIQVWSNKVIGILTLQSILCGGVFFQGDLVEERNHPFGEMVASPVLPAKLWTHQRRRQEIKLAVKENTLIDGFFEDSWGRDEYLWLTYKLNLYIWTENCEL